MNELHDDFHDDELHAQLTALADGSLEPGRAAVLQARVSESPPLAEALARQRDAVAILRDAAAATQAPLALRERLERDRARRAAPRRRRRLAGLLAAAGLAAVALAAVTVGLSSGPGAPTVAEAAGLSARPAVAPARPATPQLLAVEQSGVAFPNWERAFGWKAVGRRTDRLGGRSTTTVFYARGARRVAYTIVSGDALENPADFARVAFAGVELQVLTGAGRTDVTWLRQGHTCVVSGAGVPTARLLELAAWQGRGAVGF